MAIKTKESYITFDELVTIFDTNNSENIHRTCADFLITAITDWPTEDIIDSYEFIIELQKTVNNSLTFDNITEYLATLKPGTDAWKMESISNVLEMFDFERNHNFNKTIFLESIIEEITEHYRGGK